MSNEEISVEDSFIVLGSSPTPSMELNDKLQLESNYAANAKSTIGSNSQMNSDNCNVTHASSTAPELPIAKSEVELVSNESTATVDNATAGMSTSSIDGVISSSTVSIEEIAHAEHIRELEAENERLKQIVRTTEDRANHAIRQQATVERDRDELRGLVELERATAAELAKSLSEKESVVQNQLHLIERMKAEKQNTKSSVYDDDGQHTIQKKHAEQIKALQNEKRAVDAENSDLNVKIADYKNKLECLEQKFTAVLQVFNNNRMEITRLQEELTARTGEVNLLKTQLESNQGEMEDERPDGGDSLDVYIDKQSWNRDIVHCPLCEVRYKDLDALKNHVEECILKK